MSGENHETLRLVSVPSEIQTSHLSNANPNCKHLKRLFQYFIVIGTIIAGPHSYFVRHKKGEEKVRDKIGVLARGLKKCYYVSLPPLHLIFRLCCKNGKDPYYLILLI
jgi:hypothetical protein